MRFVKLLSCLLLAGGVAAAAAAEPRLVTVHGAVEIGRGTPPLWHAAASGMVLEPGDAVRTGAGARAELALGDARVVRLYEQSVLRVGTSVTPTGAVRSVELEEGQSLFDVFKKAIADEFDVITPEVVVSVKGTRYLVAAVPGQDYTSVFRGVVELAGPGFETVAVRPGLTGAAGELFPTPFADPWEAWERGDAAPEPLLAERREREVEDALRAAAASGAGGANGGAGADAAPAANAGLVESSGELLGAATEGAADASEPLLAGAGNAVGSVLAPVTEPVGGLLAPVTEPVGGLLAPVTEPVGGLLAPVTDPVGGLLAPVIDPVAEPVGGLVGGLLGGGFP
jgi:hypothetical protein